MFALMLLAASPLSTSPCCQVCSDNLTHYWANDTPNHECAETCLDASNRLIRAEWFVLTGGKGLPANSSTPCADAGFGVYNRTDTLGFGLVSGAPG